MPCSTFALYRVGVWGIPLATSLANLAGAGALFVLLRRRVELAPAGSTASSLARILLASAVVAASSFVVWLVLDDLLGRSLLGQLASVGGGLAAGTLAYLGACKALRVRELGALLALRRRPRA